MNFCLMINIYPFPVLDILLPLPGIDVPVLIRVHTLPMSLVAEPVARVHTGPSRVVHLSEPLSDALHKLALELVAAAVV